MLSGEGMSRVARQMYCITEGILKGQGDVKKQELKNRQ